MTQVYVEKTKDEIFLLVDRISYWTYGASIDVNDKLIDYKGVTFICLGSKMGERLVEQAIDTHGLDAYTIISSLRGELPDDVDILMVIEGKLYGFDSDTIFWNNPDICGKWFGDGSSVLSLTLLNADKSRALKIHALTDLLAKVTLGLIPRGIPLVQTRTIKIS